MQRELRRREPIEAATRGHRRDDPRRPRRPSRSIGATASTACPGASGPGHRTAPQHERPSRPERTGHRKGATSRGATAKTAGQRRFESQSRDGRPTEDKSGEWAPRAKQPPPTVRIEPAPRPDPVAPARSPADDPLVQEPPDRAAPPAATHADARAEGLQHHGLVLLGGSRR